MLSKLTIAKNPFLCQKPKICQLLSTISRGIIENREHSSTWQPLKSLRNSSIECFRKEAFAASVPAIMPKGHFRDFPAIGRWFTSPETGCNTASLNYPYLRQFNNAIISQEYTSISAGPNKGKEDFVSINAPFSIFLDWTERTTSSTEHRLYIAQASVSALPIELRNDLPTPDIVAKAGRGDIYDASIWMGVPPTYTPLHRDPNPNLFVQLAGHKVIRLLPPDIGYEVYAQVQASIGKVASANIRGKDMMIGEEKSLLDDMIWNNKYQGDKRPLLAFEAQLDCGDGVFIPRGWWHSVKGVGNGTTASINWWFR